MLNKIIYITSNDRAGSTILGNLLGQHTKICSVGELHHLPAYVKEDKSIYNPSFELVCSCGMKVKNCCFWKDVESILNRNIDDLFLKLDLMPNLKKRICLEWFINSKKPFLILKNKVISKIIKVYPFLLNSYSIYKLTEYKKMASDYWALYNAISIVTSKPFIVDSSKLPHRVMYLHKLIQQNIIPIHLVRNPVAVVCSLVKRGYSIEKGISKYVEREKTIRSVLKNFQKRSKAFIRYGDLCLQTEKTLIYLAKQINIDYEAKMMTLTIEGKHHLGGSPSKFKYDGKIRYDNSHLKYFTNNEERIILNKTMPFSKEYGYNE